MLIRKIYRINIAILLNKLLMKLITVIKSRIATMHMTKILKIAQFSLKFYKI